MRTQLVSIVNHVKTTTVNVTTNVAIVPKRQKPLMLLLMTSHDAILDEAKDADALEETTMALTSLGLNEETDEPGLPATMTQLGNPKM